MSPSIDLTDGLFARLQRHAVPLVDTPLTVIARALDALEAGDEEPVSTEAPTGPRSFNPAAPPNLAHAMPRRAEVAGNALPKGETYWNAIMFAVITEAAKKGTSVDDLIDLMTIPCVKGQKEGGGYRHLPDAGISVQGQDSNRAWKQTYRVASSIGVPVHVVFVWGENPKAAMPNVTGSLFIEG